MTTYSPSKTTKAITSRILVVLAATIVTLSVQMRSGAYPNPSNASGDAALSINLALESGANLTQGEPIVLRYTLTNSSASKLIGFEKKDGHRWLTEMLTGPLGTVVPPAPQFDPQVYAGGVRTDPYQIVTPSDGSTQGFDVVSRNFPSLAPGKYTLTVTANLPYGSDLDSVPLADSGPGEAKATYTFPIVIAALDEAKLQAAAAALTSNIMKGNAADPKRNMQVASLLLMPGALTKTFWTQVILHRIDISEELYQAHTAEAADVLALMASTHGATGLEYRQWLDRMYQTSDGALKQHIHDLYISNGLPSKHFATVDTN